MSKRHNQARDHVRVVQNIFTDLHRSGSVKRYTRNDRAARRNEEVTVHSREHPQCVGRRNAQRQTQRHQRRHRCALAKQHR